MKTRILKQPRAFVVAASHRIRSGTELQRKLQSLFAFDSNSVLYFIFDFSFSFRLVA